MISRLAFVWLSVLFVGCATSSSIEPVVSKSIGSSTPLASVVEAGILHGGATLDRAKRVINKRKERSDAGNLLHQSILKNFNAWNSVKLINAINLLLWTKKSNLVDLFDRLLASNRVLHNQLGWHVAASAPSKEMAKAIDQTLTERLTDNTMTGLFVPEMAEAVSSNQLKSSYTLVRLGLFESNNVAFVQSMIELDRKRASADFLDYLALASLEELRQLNLRSIDLFAARAILQHLSRKPAPINHRHSAFLFYYAISRNRVLADLGMKAVEANLPEHQKNLAIMLGDQPAWIQIAFVERVRRKMSPLLGLFLNDLKEATGQREVVEEISSIKR